MGAPRYSLKNTVAWSKAPGVSTGYFQWGTSHAPSADKTIAHCRRIGVRSVQAICGAKFDGGVEFPSTDAKACPACLVKAKAQEEALARTPRKLRDEASKIVLS